MKGKGIRLLAFRGVRLEYQQPTEKEVKEMGADLVLSHIEIRESKEEALERLAKIVFTKESLDLFSNAGYYFWEDEEFSPEVAEQMRERVKESINLVYGLQDGTIYSRDVAGFSLDCGERYFLVTGGQTWGDDPSSEYADFNIFSEFIAYPYWQHPTSEAVTKWKAGVK
jgi:hypothetical protein